MLRILKIIGTLALLIFISGIVLAADWECNPYDCPTTAQAQTCSGSTLVCGISGGITYCAEPPFGGPPSANDTSNSGDTYQSGCEGGFIVDCESYDGSDPHCDNAGDFWCNRNVTCYTTYHRQTRCIEDLWSNDSVASDCQGCRTDGSDYNDCDTDTVNCEIRDNAACGDSTGTYDGCLVIGSGGTGNCTSSINSDCDDDDSDGNIETCNSGNYCEITGGGSCGDSTGTYVNNQCDGAEGNCTRTGTNLDCNDDDGDSNEITCNNETGDGCEVEDGGSCSVGSLSGTIDGCTGGAANCVVDKQCFVTGNETQYQTNATEHFLWGTDYGTLGDLLRLNNTNYGIFSINASGCLIWMDGTTACTAPTGSMSYTNLALTNVSETWDAGLNITLGVGGWFKGLFNWTVLTNWLSFDGSTLIFNETKHNESVRQVGVDAGFNSTYNVTYAGSINNASYLETYNVTYDGCVNNASYLATYNATYDATTTQWDGNYSILAGCVNNASYLSTYNVTYAGSINNASYLSTYNATYDGSVNNASYLATYNITYDAYTTLNSTNTSNYWDDLNTTNSTQIENNGGILNILVSWLESLFVSDSDLPLANQTSPHCSNITGNATDLCTITAGAGGGGNWVNDSTESNNTLNVNANANFSVGDGSSKWFENGTCLILQRDSGTEIALCD